MNPTHKAILITFAILSLIIIPVSYVQAADFKAVGDVGCKSNSKATLKNIAKLPGISFFGLGDYMYSCSPSGELATLWNNIPSKRGVPGNHECENGQQASWAASTFGYSSCSKGYSTSIRGGNVAVIGINPYTSYKAGSTQYKYVESQTQKYSNQSMKIVYIMHEPIYTPTFSGGHSPNTGLRTAYLPLIQQYDVFVIAAHNHGTAFGNIQGVEMAICGGGGYGGDGGGSLNGFSWATATTFGYCLFHFEPNNINVKLIGTDNKVKHIHTYN